MKRFRRWRRRVATWRERHVWAGIAHVEPTLAQPVQSNVPRYTRCAERCVAKAREVVLARHETSEGEGVLLDLLCNIKPVRVRLCLGQPKEGLAFRPNTKPVLGSQCLQQRLVAWPSVAELACLRGCAPLSGRRLFFFGRTQ